MPLKRAMRPADHVNMTGARKLNDKRGYTLVELLVAAFVLVIGMAGAFALLNGANRSSTTNNARMGATNLARELLEDARSVDYHSLTPTGVLPALQAKAGVTGNPTPWVVARRGIQYTVTSDVCTFDDPKDNIAAAPPANVCTPQAPVPASATGLEPEIQPDDFRRVTVNIAWNTGSGDLTLKQVSLINNPSGGLGPRITLFNPPIVLANGNSGQVTGGTGATFPTTTTTAGSVRWNSDGTPNGSGDSTGGPTTWGTTWQLGTAPVGTDPLTAGWSTTQYDAATAVLDGTYTVTAQAFDDLGIAGDSRAAVLPLNRSQPITVTGFDAGVNFNTNLVEFHWNQNPELDIIGYRVYDLGPDNTLGNGNDTLICSTAKAIDTMCTTSIPSGTPDYGVVALDLTDITDTSSAPRESQFSTRKTLDKTEPASPSGLLGGLSVTPDLATLKPKLDWGPRARARRPSTGSTARRAARAPAARWPTATTPPRRPATSTRRRRAAPTTTGSRPSARTSTSRLRSARFSGWRHEPPPRQAWLHADRAAAGDVAGAGDPRRDADVVHQLLPLAEDQPDAQRLRPGGAQLDGSRGPSAAQPGQPGPVAADDHDRPRAPVRPGLPDLGPVAQVGPLLPGHERHRRPALECRPRHAVGVPRRRRRPRRRAG